MRSGILTRISTLTSTIVCGITTAGGCSGETAGHGGRSETDFVECNSDAVCSAGEKCIEQQCRRASDAGNDGDAGNAACPLHDLPTDSSTWAEASAQYPDTCLGDQGAPYQATCGNYNVIISFGTDNSYTEYYEKSTGAYVGVVEHGVGAGISWTHCWAYSSEFVPVLDCHPYIVCDGGSVDGEPGPDAAAADGSANLGAHDR